MAMQTSALRKQPSEPIHEAINQVAGAVTAGVLIRIED